MINTINDLNQLIADCESCDQVLNRLIEQQEVVSPSVAVLILSEIKPITDRAYAQVA